MKTYTVEVRDNGDKCWYLNGNLHREDGPAAEFVDGTKEWFLNGNLHREDGPAIEWVDGTKSWYIDGKELTEAEFNNRNHKTIVIDGKSYMLVEV